MHQGHQLDSLFFENTPAIELAAVEHHAGKARQVGGGGEQPGVPSDAAHPPGGRVVDDAVQEFAVHPLGRRGAAPLGQRLEETGVAHAKRMEQMRGRKLVQPLPGGQADDLAKEDEVNVAVAKIGVRLGGQPLGLGQGDGPWHADPRRLGRQAGAQPGGVRQQLPDGHGPLAVGLEAGNPAAHPVVEPELAALDEPHDGRRGGDNLGQRCTVKDRVGGHRQPLRLDHFSTVCFLINRPAMLDAKHRTGRLAGDDGALD